MASWRPDQPSPELDPHPPCSRVATRRFANSSVKGISKENLSNQQTSSSKAPSRVSSTKSSTFRESTGVEILPEDDMTLPLNIQGSTTIMRTGQKNKHELCTSDSAHMGISASNLDRQIADFFCETPGMSPEMKRLPLQSLKSSGSSFETPKHSSACRPIPGHGCEVHRSLEGHDHGVQSLKMAGSRPSSLATSGRERTRAASRASSHDRGTEQFQSPGYIFIHELPPLPPLQTKKSKFTSLIDRNSCHPDNYRPFHTAEQKGKGRSFSRTSAPRLDELVHESHEAKNEQRSRPAPDKLLDNPSDGQIADIPSIIKSPQHAWYLLRRLVGLELRWEAARAWRLTTLEYNIDVLASEKMNDDSQVGEGNDSDDESSYSANTWSIESSTSAVNLPLLRYLIRHFFLTLPIIRDTVASAPNPLDALRFNSKDSGPSTSPSMYWTAGVLPVLRRLHQSNLSAAIDLGSPGFLDIFFGSYVARMLERYIATSLKVSHQEDHSAVGQELAYHMGSRRNGGPQFGEGSNFNNVIAPESDFSYQRPGKIATDSAKPRTTEDQVLFSTAGWSPKPIRSHLRGFAMGTDMIPHKSSGFNQVPAAGPSHSYAKTVEQANETYMRGFEKEPHWYSGVSVDPSQRASIGVFTPSNSNRIVSPSSHLGTTEYETSVNGQQNHRQNNLSTNVSEIPCSLLSNNTLSSDAASPVHTSAVQSPITDLFTWIPNVFDNIEAPPMDLSRTVGFSHEGNLKTQDSHSPCSLDSGGYQCRPEILAQEDAPSVRKTIQRLKLAGGYQSDAPDAQEKRARTSRLLQEFSWKNLALSKTPSIIRSYDGHDVYDRGTSAFQKLDPAVLKRTMSLDLMPNNPPGATSESEANTRIENPSNAGQKKIAIKGYDVVETESLDMNQTNSPLFTLMYPGGRQLTANSHNSLQVTYTPSRVIQTNVLSTESLGHYQKRTNNLNAYETSRQSSVNPKCIAELHEKPSVQSPSEFEVDSKPRRRFTLRSFARWRQSVRSEEGLSQNERSDYVFPSTSPKGVFSIRSRSSSAEGTDQAFSQTRSSFYAEMTVPESLIRGLSLPYEPIHQSANIPIQPKISQIPKDSVRWPWGDPVPFWKGTPVHKVSWGGFEADIVGIRKALTGNRYLIRVRRPSRLDEYVVRKESQFKKYLSALSREFPNAHIRMIPNHETSFEDELICPDAFLNETNPLVWGDPEISSRRDIDPTHKLGTQFSGAFNSIQKNQADDIGINMDKSGRHMKFQEPNTGGIAHFPDRNLNVPHEQIAPDRSPDIMDGVSRPGLPKRRNTLASLFAAGNIKSKFSFDTRSDLNKEFRNGNSRRDEIPGSVSADRKTVGDCEQMIPGCLSRRSSSQSIKASPDAFRRALRGWLRDTLSIRTVGHHRETAAFLLLGSIVPGEEDLLDIRKREMIDEDRRKKRVRVAQGAAERAKAIYECWSQVKEEFIDGQGIENLSKALKQFATIEELPISFQKALEWMRMKFAEALHELLVVGNQSDVLFGKLLGFHAAFPWFLIKNILKIRKPDLMCKTLVEVLLSKKLPVGKTKRNVVQRLVEIAINETDGDPSEVERRIQSCRARIQSLTMCEKIIKFAHASREIKNLFRYYAESENLELVVTIVRSAEEPRLDKYDLERIMRASQVYRSQLKKHRNRITSSMTGDINVRLILDLKLYLRLISQERDSKQIREMFSDQKIAEALEILIFPFKEFLKRTYILADASQAVDAAENFIGQLITIVNALRSRIQDPQKSVRVLSRLLAKHQNTFYGWLHSIHMQETIIQDFLDWLSTAIQFLKQGLLEPILISHIVSPRDAENLAKELDDLVEWEERKRKLQYEELCRRYSADVDGDDPVIVEGDGFGRSKVEPLTEARPSPPPFDHITNCLSSFRMAISRVLAPKNT